MKNLIDICAKHGIQFVNRSYGKATTSTVALDAMEKIVADAQAAHDPIEAGELLADYIVNKRRKIANLSGAAWNAIDSEPHLYEQFYLVWERDFWRTLALEGAEKIKQEIANL